MDNEFTEERLVQSYKDTFLLADGTLRDSARDIFRHLLSYSHFYDDSVETHATALARMSGRRDVVASILRKLNISEETIVTYNSGGANHARLV